MDARLARVPSPRYCWSSRRLGGGFFSLLGPKSATPQSGSSNKSFEPRPGKRSSASPPSRYLELVLGDVCREPQLPAYLQEYKQIFSFQILTLQNSAIFCYTVSLFQIAYDQAFLSVAKFVIDCPTFSLDNL